MSDGKYAFEKSKIIQGDCLEKMKLIPDGSIDMVLADLPYGVTSCKWDAVIPFEPLWEQYERIIKNDGAIVLTSVQPFTSALVNSLKESRTKEDVLFDELTKDISASELLAAITLIKRIKDDNSDQFL